ncbi:MAG: DNA polymerase III subunit beta [Candidatus Marinimicrobia bacterium]|nr:DNA polymerase III subunit beta [Candidatus Neomarinimicrobiota bacterium]
MNFKVSKKEFYSILSKISKVTPTRSTLPILSCILFTAEKDTLHLRSTDLEITMSANCSATVEEEGSIAIPSKIILNITSELPDTDLNFEISEEHIILTTPKGGEYKIMGKPASEFPSIPIINQSKVFSLPSDKFHRIIEKTTFASSHDEDMHAALNGVLFQFNDNKLVAVSTDGHQLSKFVLKEYDSSEDIRDIVVPIKFLNLCAISIKNLEKVKIRIGKNHIMMEGDKSIIYSRLLEHKFPDYESVIPTSNEKKIVIDIDKLIQSTKRIGIFANESSRLIVFSFSENNMNISAEDTSMASSASEDIDVEYTGDDFKIAYNNDKLREILRHIDGDKLKIYLNTPLSAGLFFPFEQKEGEDSLFLLMPLRTGE